MRPGGGSKPWLATVPDAAFDGGGLLADEPARRRRPLLFALLLALGLLLAALWLPSASQAQDDAGQAGIVVVGPEGELATACVPTTAAANGLELLDASAIPYTAAINNFGTTVCAVNGSGCPADDCWCQCKGGGECVYWSLWQQIDGQWQYANVGAAQLPVNDGTIQGWVWGPGTPGAAPAPPEIDLAEICAAPAPASPAPTAAPAAADAAATPNQLVTPAVVVLFVLLALAVAFWLLRRRAGDST